MADKSAISCETCPCFVAAGDIGHCHADPPQLFLLPGPPDFAGRPQIVHQSIWRPVKRDDWCARHPMFGVAMPIDRRLAQDAEGAA